MRTKQSMKAQTKKRVKKNKHKKELETLSQNNEPDEILDKEDREAEIVLNDLVPQNAKEEFGINKNENKNPRKGGLKLNLFPKQKKSTKQVRRLKDEKVIKNKIVENTKEDIEQTSINDEQTSINNDEKF